MHYLTISLSMTKTMTFILGSYMIGQATGQMPSASWRSRTGSKIIATIIITLVTKIKSRYLTTVAVIGVIVLMLSNSNIMGYIADKISNAINNDTSELSERRQKMLNLYRGDHYGNEVIGYSKVVTREVFEAIEWAMPMIIKAFVSSERAVLFDPVSEEDVAQAELETEYVNHVLLKSNNGFYQLHQWFKDALMYPNGYIKVYTVDKASTTINEYTGLTEAQLVELGVGEKQVDVLEHNTYDKVVLQEMPDGSQVEVNVIVFDVKLKKRVIKKQIVVEAVPPEQVLVDDQVRSLDLDTANFICHRTLYNKAELLSMGYDADKLAMVGSTDDHSWDDETVNRLFHEDETPHEQPNDYYWVHECYCWIDYDEDGVDEYRRIVSIGGTIFENEETDYQPIVALSSIVMSHQHAGISLAESVGDLQRVQSALVRNLLDNIYRINKPRKYISTDMLEPDGSTIDAMLDGQADIIPVRGDPHSGEKTEQIVPLVSHILPVIKEIDDRVATRTGIAPQLSLDPSVLQGSTMGAFLGALSKANERLEMVIRVFAETGVRTLMSKIHHLSRSYYDSDITIMIKGKWTSIRPSDWNERDNLTVQVGLGFNNQTQLLDIYNQLLGLQKEAMSAGLSDHQKIYRTLERMLNVLGMNAFEYFNDPNNPEWQPPQPTLDPMLELTEKQIQQQAALDARAQDIKIQEMQLKHEKMMADLQLEHQEAVAKIRNTNANTALTWAKTASETGVDSVLSNVIDKDNI